MKDGLDVIPVSISGALHNVGKQSKPLTSLERTVHVPQVRLLHQKAAPSYHYQDGGDSAGSS